MTRLINKYWRLLKVYCIKSRPRLLTRIVFGLLSFYELNFSNRKMNQKQLRERSVWKKQYLKKYNPKKPFNIVCDKYISENSDDHKLPRGAINDSSVNLKFNKKIHELLNFKSDLYLLDLGCAGGGMVKSLLEDGFVAIGLEGSDIPKKLGLGEWDICPYHLFTCDITSNFTIFSDVKEKVMFDVITSWELLEHIPEKQINPLILNISNHIKYKGYFI